VTQLKMEAVVEKLNISDAKATRVFVLKHRVPRHKATGAIGNILA
jgi:hypothetical protein